MSLAAQVAKAREEAENPMNARVSVVGKELVLMRDLVGESRVIVFGLPTISLTRTCTEIHLAGFEEVYDVLKKNHGVSEIYCAFQGDVGAATAAIRNAGFSRINVISDSMADLCGLLGVGSRGCNQRYAALFDGGKLQKVYSDKNADQVLVSGSDTMFKLVAPNAPYPSRVAIIAPSHSPEAKATKAYFAALHILSHEILLDTAWNRTIANALSGSTQLPQIFIDGKHAPNFYHEHVLPNRPFHQ